MKNKQAKNQSKSSTEKYLFVSTVRDDTVVLNNGGLRAVLLTSSVNFALKDEDEQQGLVQNYVSMLNSIDFPLQISVQSRKLNIDSYVDRLEKREKEIENELLKVQVQDYKKFVLELLDIGDIMSKNFYVVVPYEPGGNEKKSFMTQLSEIFTATNVVKLSRKKFDQYKSELERRVSLVESGLSGMGLNSVRLDTQGLIEMLYNSYNPIVSEFEKIDEDLNKLDLQNK